MLSLVCSGTVQVWWMMHAKSVTDHSKTPSTTCYRSHSEHHQISTCCRTKTTTASAGSNRNTWSSSLGWCLADGQIVTAQTSHNQYVNEEILQTSSSSTFVLSSNARISAIVKPYHWSVQQKTCRWKLLKILRSPYYHHIHSTCCMPIISLFSSYININNCPENGNVSR